MYHKLENLNNKKVNLDILDLFLKTGKISAKHERILN